MLLEFDNFKISITRKSIKNIYLRVQSTTGTITLSAPLNTPESVILKFLQKNRAWLQRHASETKAPSLPNDQIALWGKTLPLKISIGQTPIRITPTPLAFLLHLPKSYSNTIIASIIDAWRKQEVLQKAAPYVELWQDRFCLPSINTVCRKMKSRWGSCSWNKNKITLNSTLSEKPIDCLELVIVHELTHFYIHNHSPAFYQKLAQALPDWQVRDKYLKIS